jgi:hypothetical protein
MHEMSERKIVYKKNEFIKECPKCGNNTEFTIHSDYCAEDCCEVWAVCKCGFDPTAEGKGWGNRYEDVWGGCSDENCQAALLCSWNETIELLEA